jgi:hypothetical protein
MDAIILIVSVVLPLLPVVLFPTRFFGRGLGGTIFGAVLVVGMMMLVYWSLSAVTGDTLPNAADGVSGADIAALQKLF